MSITIITKDGKSKIFKNGYRAWKWAIANTGWFSKKKKKDKKEDEK